MSRIMGLVALAAGWLLATDVAFAAPVLRVTVTEPNMTQLGLQLADLANCKVRIRNAQGGVLAEQEYTASSAAGAQSRTVDFADLNAIETMTEVVQRCTDALGNVSVDSSPRTFTFSDAPAPGSVDGVQIVP